MSTLYKHQDDFADQLAQRWLYRADRPDIRRTIRALKNKAQAAYIAARMTFVFMSRGEHVECQSFLYFMHPNLKD